MSSPHPRIAGRSSAGLRVARFLGGRVGDARPLDAGERPWHMRLGPPLAQDGLDGDAAYDPGPGGKMRLIPGKVHASREGPMAVEQSIKNLLLTGPPGCGKT